MAFLIKLPISSEYIILGLFIVVITVTLFKSFKSGINPKPRGWCSYTTPGVSTLSTNPLVIAGIRSHQIGKIKITGGVTADHTF